MFAVSVTLTALLALTDAHPHHQQLVYPSAGGVYYLPQPGASSFTSVQRYAAPVPVAPPLPIGVAPGSPQYILLYPGGPQNNFVHTHRADGESTNPPTIWNLFNFFQRPTTAKPTKVDGSVSDEVTTTPPPVTTPSPVTTRSPVTTPPPTTVATTVEETTPKSPNEASAKPEKLVDEEIMMAVEQAGFGGDKASLETLDENIPPNPQPSPDGSRFVLVQPPQFFGNYDLLHQRDMQQSLGIPPGAVSNFLLFKHGFMKPAQAQPNRPLKMQVEGDQVPGAAALAFQQAMTEARFRAHQGLATSRGQLVSNPHPLAPNQQVFTYQRQLPSPGLVHISPAHHNLYLIPPKTEEPAHAVVVDADRPKKDETKGDSEEIEPAGPSVAQAKPQAIALAGVGGMAAAAPVATAVVGPGGLAVSAPMATAVAGQSGGGSLVGPAQAAIAAANKHINKNKGNKVKSDDNYKPENRYQ